MLEKRCSAWFTMKHRSLGIERLIYKYLFGFKYVYAGHCVIGPPGSWSGPGMINVVSAHLWLGSAPTSWRAHRECRRILR